MCTNRIYRFWAEPDLGSSEVVGDSGLYLEGVLCLRRIYRTRQLGRKCHSTAERNCWFAKALLHRLVKNYLSLHLLRWQKACYRGQNSRSIICSKQSSVFCWWELYCASKAWVEQFTTSLQFMWCAFAMKHKSAYWQVIEYPLRVFMSHESWWSVQAGDLKAREVYPM